MSNLTTRELLLIAAWAMPWSQALKGSRLRSRAVREAVALGKLAADQHDANKRAIEAIAIKHPRLIAMGLRRG